MSEATKFTPGPWRYQEASDAYTHIVRAGEHYFVCQLPQDTSGMSLRDWFAGQALTGMASISLEDGDMIMGWAAMAKASYRAADAMLAARATGEGR